MLDTSITESNVTLWSNYLSLVQVIHETLFKKTNKVCYLIPGTDSKLCTWRMNPGYEMRTEGGV